MQKCRTVVANTVRCIDFLYVYSRASG